MVAVLTQEGGLTKGPGGKRDFATITDALNQWMERWGWDLTVISSVLLEEHRVDPAPPYLFLEELGLWRQIQKPLGKQASGIGSHAI